MKILVIEDDPMVAEALGAILAHHNYVVEVATDGQSGWELLQTLDYDLIISDIVLPKIDGITLCRQVRSHGIQTPVLLLTARNSSHDTAIGLDAGADDYLTKPFDPEELEARIRALLRRVGENNNPLLCWGALKLDPSCVEVTHQGAVLPLTPKEYALLELFLRNPKRVFSCSAILDHLWVYEDAPGEEAVRTHIKGLRHKLKGSGIPSDMIETVYGIGYRLKPTEPEPEATPTSVTDGDAKVTKTTALIQTVWEKSQARVKEQLTIVKKAITHLSKHGTLPAAIAEPAIHEAHTLAGSLGMFGFPTASDLARSIEMTLKRQADSPDLQDPIDLQNWFRALKKAIKQPPTQPAVSLPEPADSLPLVLMIDRAVELTQAVMTGSSSYGFRVEGVNRLSRAREKIYQAPPKAVILDPDITPDHQDSLAFLLELNQQLPPIPAVIVTQYISLQERLEVVRSGGRAFLQKPTSAQAILAAVDQVLTQVEQAKSRILLLDDDPVVLSIVKSLLQPWGLNVVTLEDPKKFWEVLEQTNPDLLILDIAMPDISGIEVCQTVRNDLRWSDLPILFLTAHKDVDTVNQVFSAGGDDFVSKPIIGPELVTRVINRLERMKLLQRRYQQSLDAVN